jgi:hypothetical protein
MNDPNELADRYVALWNEPDPDGRRPLSFAGSFTPQAILRRMMGRVLRPAPPTESRCLDDTDQRR